jgi:hypothetical protein
VAALLGFFSEPLHLGSAPFAAGLAMIAPIIGFRDFWNERRFWVTVLLLGAAQVPLVILVRPLIEKLKFPLMFTFGIFDAVLVLLAISWVCSEHNRKSA